ncbi:MAG: hypothetical protein ABI051_01375 [Vicinamibacterales bacterium]
MRALKSLAILILLASLSAPPVALAQGGRSTPPPPPAAPQAPVAPQSPTPPAAPTPRPPLPPVRQERAVRIDIVLSRTQGEKKVSSFPFTLYTAAGSNVSLRSGSSVPVPQGAGAIAYQSVGVRINCVNILDLPDGRFRLDVEIDDSSVLDNGPMTANGPVIRSSNLRGTVVARDGSAQTFATATDKLTGETIKAEVTVTALK